MYGRSRCSCWVLVFAKLLATTATSAALALICWAVLLPFWMDARLYARYEEDLRHLATCDVSEQAEADRRVNETLRLSTELREHELQLCARLWMNPYQ